MKFAPGKVPILGEKGGDTCNCSLQVLDIIMEGEALKSKLPLPDLDDKNGLYILVYN